MGPIFFAVKDQNDPVKVSFTEVQFIRMYRPYINGVEVPLLLESYQIEDAFDKINLVKEKMKSKNFIPSLEYLSEVIKGAAKISMCRYF